MILTGFVEELTRFMDSETDGYSLGYHISEIDDDGGIEVVTWRHGDTEKEVKEDSKNSTYWRWDPINKSLMIEVGEDTDVWEVVCYYDWTVKYFWMMVAGYLFNNGECKNDSDR